MVTPWWPKFLLKLKLIDLTDTLKRKLLKIQLLLMMQNVAYVLHTSFPLNYKEYGSNKLEKLKWLEDDIFKRKDSWCHGQYVIRCLLELSNDTGIVECTSSKIHNWGWVERSYLNKFIEFNMVDKNQSWNKSKRWSKWLRILLQLETNHEELSSIHYWQTTTILKNTKSC